MTDQDFENRRPRLQLDDLLFEDVGRTLRRQSARFMRISGNPVVIINDVVGMSWEGGYFEIQIFKEGDNFVFSDGERVFTKLMRLDSEYYHKDLSIFHSLPSRHDVVIEGNEIQMVFERPYLDRYGKSLFVERIVEFCRVFADAQHAATLKDRA